MADSLRERALVDLGAKLNAGSPPVSFTRAWTWAVRPENLPFATYHFADPRDTGHPMSEEVRPATTQKGALVARSCVVAVQVTVKGDGTTPPDKTVDAILVWAQKATVGQSLDGVYKDVEEVGTSFRPAQADYPYCRATLYLRVLYQSKTQDPTAYN